MTGDRARNLNTRFAEIFMIVDENRRTSLKNELYQFKNNINLQTTPTISFKYRQDFADFGIVAYQISIAHCLYVGTSICIVIIMRDD